MPEIAAPRRRFTLTRAVRSSHSPSNSFFISAALFFGTPPPATRSSSRAPARMPGEGKGGGVDSHSIFAGDGMVFIASGYGSFRQPPGNVLLAFRPKKK